jgi:hypothetical protein
MLLSYCIVWFLHQSGLLGPAVKTVTSFINQAVKAVIEHTNAISAASKAASGSVDSPPPPRRRSALNNGVPLGYYEDGSPISPSSISLSEGNDAFTPGSGPPSSSGRPQHELFRRAQSFNNGAAIGALSRGSSFREAPNTPPQNGSSTPQPSSASSRRSFTGIVPNDGSAGSNDTSSKKDA